MKLLSSIALGVSALLAVNVFAISPVSKTVPIPQHAVFIDGFHADIRPHGWLKEILVRQDSGLTSHPEAMSYPFDSDLWIGDLKRDSEN